MKRLLAISLLAVNFLFLSACLAPCFSYGQSSVGEDKYIEGRIANVSFVRPAVSIKFVQSNGGNDEVVFLVTSHTQIVKGNLSLSLTELRQGDQAIIKYHDDPGSFGSLKADSINVKPLSISGTRY